MAPRPGRPGCRGGVPCFASGAEDWRRFWPVAHPRRGTGGQPDGRHAGRGSGLSRHSSVPTRPRPHDGGTGRVGRERVLPDPPAGPGFQEYFLVETSEGVLSISVFADQAGAEESTRRAADWVQQNLTGFFTGPPTVTTGSVWLHAVGGEMSGTPTP